MGFSEDIKKCFSFCNTPLRNYRITLLGESGAYLEGISKIIKISENEIDVLASDKKIILKGEKLKLGAYTECDAYILGKISEISKL